MSWIIKWIKTPPPNCDIAGIIDSLLDDLKADEKRVKIEMYKHDDHNKHEMQAKIMKGKTQLEDELARNTSYLQFEAQLKSKIYSLAHQVKKLEWKYRFNEDCTNQAVLGDQPNNDPVYDPLQDINQNYWVKTEIKDEPPKAWNAKNQTYHWKGPTQGVLILYEYWKNRPVNHNSDKKTTTLEVMLDIFITTGFNGSVNRTGENWKLSELHADFIYNLKQFFKLVVKPNIAIILQRGHTLTKYNIGTSCMTLPFKVQLQNESSVIELLHTCSVGNNHINKWWVRNDIGPNSWPYLDTLDSNSCLVTKPEKYTD